MSENNAGADVDAYCTKCKMDLAHVVIAVAKNRIVRVECKTCRGVHAYRGKGEPKKTRAAAKTKSTVKRPTTFDAAMEGRDLSRARPYRVSEAFSPDQLIDHKTFGLGLVTQALDDLKIQVVFKDGPKVLVHAREVQK